MINFFLDKLNELNYYSLLELRRLVLLQSFKSTIK
jgi:hypothetical protein